MESESIMTLFVTLFGGGGLVTLLFRKLDQAHTETVNALKTALEKTESTATLAVAKAEERAEKWEAFGMETFQSFRTAVQGFGQATAAVQTLSQK